MALQAATGAKTASDGVILTPRDVVDSLVMDVIDAQITADSTRDDQEEPIYRTDFDFEAEVVGDVVHIVQSDETKVLLSDVLSALTAAEYRTSDYLKPSFRDDAPDRVHIAVAWG